MILLNYSDTSHHFRCCQPLTHHPVLLREGWSDWYTFNSCPIYLHASFKDGHHLIDLDPFHVNALPSRTREAVVWQTGLDQTPCRLVGRLALQPGAPLADLWWIYFLSQKREVSSMPAPSPLLNPLTWLCSAISWLAMTNREKNTHTHTCRARKQIICFCWFDFVVIWWCRSPQSGRQSWEFWERKICLFIFCFSLFFCGLC